MAVNRKSAGANVALALANIKRRSGADWVTATIAKKRSAGGWVDLFPVTGAVVNDATYSASAITPDDATIDLAFNTVGNVVTTENAAVQTTRYSWLVTGAVGDYDILATVTAGSVEGSATGVWLNLGISRNWSVTNVSNLAGTVSATMTIEIRNATTLAVIDSGIVTLEASVL